MWFVAHILDEPFHIGDPHAKGRARGTNHVLFDHDAPEIVRAVLEGHLPNVQALRNPGTLHTGNVVQINAAERLGAKIFVRPDGRALENRVVWLKCPADESGESASGKSSGFKGMTECC